MTFASRQQAGRMLGRHLLNERVEADLVAGIPRGGVVVAQAVAEMLRLPFDAVVARKIGHPLNREFAIGAISENGAFMLDDHAIRGDPDMRRELQIVVTEETERLQAYRSRFCRPEKMPLAEQRVILVDDGFATGFTMLAAVRAVRAQGAARIIVAAPVASESAAQALAKVADQVLAMNVDPALHAIGHYYQDFEQVTDEEVFALLNPGGRD